MRPGEQIDDYTIVSKLGEGGMSVVYLATQASQGTRVVVKQLKDQYRFDQQLIDRFRREAAILQELRHPHLARVYGCPNRDGHYYMIQEYLPGGSLSDLLRNRLPYSEDEAIGWCCDALRAMNYVHENGIVHRDLKPSNLMLDDKRRIRVIDFGIARAFGERRLTRTSDGAIGTLEYMSPEQILTPDKVDYLTDVYSMGIVLYELLTGEVPFEGPSTFAVQEKITRHAPPPLRQFGRNVAPLNPNGTAIDPRLAKIVLRALDKRPERRFGGCAEFAMQLARFSTRRSGSSWIRQASNAARDGVSAVAASSSQRGILGVVALLTLALVLWRVTGFGAPGRAQTGHPENPTPPSQQLPAKADERLEAQRQEEVRQADERRQRDTERERVAQEAKRQEEIRLVQEAERLKQERAAQDAKRQEEIRLAQEAERLKLERAAQDVKRQEEIRLAQEAERLKLERAAQDAKRQEEIRLAQEAERLKQERAAQDAKRQEEIRLAQEAERLKQERAVQDAKRQEQIRLAQEAERLKQERAAQDAKRQEEIRLAQEAERLKQERAALDAKRQEEIRLAQEAERLKQERAALDAKRQEQVRLAQEAERLKQAAAGLFANIKGTWIFAEEDKNEESRTRTEDVLTIDAGGSGVLTRTVTKYEKGYTGWKSAGSDVSRFSIRCDAAGRVSGDLSGRISLQGPRLLLGTSSFARK